MGRVRDENKGSVSKETANGLLNESEITEQGGLGKTERSGSEINREQRETKKGSSMGKR